MKAAALLIVGLNAAWVLCLFAVIFLTACLKSYAVVAPPPPLPERDYRVRVVEAVLLAEARGEGPGGVQRVAEVIRNRMIQSGRTAIHEVTRPFQFSCLNGINGDILLEKREGWSIPSETATMARRCAIQLVFPHGFEFGSTDLTHGATHYHAAGPKPKWAGGRKPVHAHGNHIFYKLN